MVNASGHGCVVFAFFLLLSGDIKTKLSIEAMFLLSKPNMALSGHSQFILMANTHTISH